MPSYTESKTPGLNGNPIMPKNSTDMSQHAYIDAKKPKPLLGRPIIIEAATPIPVMTYTGATYYFNGPTQFNIDAVANIKESIKKQM